MTAHHSAFSLTRTSTLDALGICVQEFSHTATGLIHYHLACNNDENALMIGFATQPTTSMGEAHILEHTVLCGSEKYPVRDPFFSMIKRSLQTFMNAMTASDWTVYPFATQNKKDFFNLMRVYTDATLFPNIHPLDFAQEGIRLEINDNNEPEFHGIVFNEMKGAMSGEIDQLYYALVPHLFSTTTYHYNSGGNPADIEKLTHKDLVEFHQKYYHPSNAIVMSFGNIPAEEIQEELEKSLARFNDIEKPKKSKRFFVTPEVRRTAPIKVQDTYTADKIGSQMTHQVIAWLLPAITDPKTRLAMRLMEGVLIEHSGLPLRQYLETTPLGQAPSPLLGLDDSHFEMVFYTGLRGSEIAHSDSFEQEILALLSDVASRPIDPETIETILHQMELDERHIGGDSMPYGLTLMLEGFSTAIHGGNPVDVWQVGDSLTWLKQQLQDDMWLPNLIKTHLVNNPHRVQLTLAPDDKKAARLIQEEQDRLAQINKRLSADDKANIIKQSQELKARQAMDDDIELLPKVTLDDVPSDIEFANAVLHPLTINGVTGTLYEYPKGTNGLYYYQLFSQIDDKITNNPLLPLYLHLLSELGTDSYSAREFQAVQARHSSGITARISQRTDKNNKDASKSFFVLATRSLSSKTEAIELIKHTLSHTVFTETERIAELLKERQLSWQSRLSQAGHSYAMQTASRSGNPTARLEYAYAGLPALRALKAFLAKADHDHTAYHQLAHALHALHNQLINLPKSAILVCESEHSSHLIKSINDTIASFDTATSQTSSIPADFEALTALLDGDNDDVAWLIASNVYHNAASYQAVPSGHTDAPALMALAVFLRNNYLHSAIREKGGAYGGGASFDPNSASFRFFSYRDPHCQETYRHFKDSIDWFINTTHEHYLLEECILGLIASLDKPASPAGDAIKACFSELHGRDKAHQIALRQNILTLTLDDLKRVAITYLKDKPSMRASLAPIEKENEMTQLGFKVEKLS